MTDNTATHNEGLWLPDEAWATIASFLENGDLARFRQLCTATQFVGSDVFIMQPLYNRLYALDNTLPPMLPPEGALVAFKQAFEKIQARQQFEITYLTQHHPALMAKREYVQAFQESATVSLQSLEAINVVLDKINSEIITARIHITSSSLHLGRVGITRFPVMLFQEPTYAHFWQNLMYLFCDNNQLTTLNVQGLTALQGLWCSKNQLTTLNVQGLMALQLLFCHINQLTTLNVQGLTALQRLVCRDNQLTSLNVQGLTALQELLCYNNQLTTLNVQGLMDLQLLFCDNNQLTTLNVQGLAALQQLGCDNNQLTTLNAQGLKMLQEFCCNDNQLTSLNVQGLTALQQLTCYSNQLAVLNVQGLTALQQLLCNDNQLTVLNVQGLAALTYLNCNNNQLTSLNVQGLAALQDLDCDNNRLKTLILMGVHADTKNKYAELERSLLFNKLSKTKSPQARQAIISRLGDDYTHENCRHYCPVYAAKLFAFDSANSIYNFASSALSQACSFLPSFSLGMTNNAPENTNLKRKRDDNEIRIEEASEDSENLPPAKKRKRK